MPLYLTEADVEELLSPADAVEAVEGSLRRQGGEGFDLLPRHRLQLEGGSLAIMGAADAELGYAGSKTYAAFKDGARSVVALFGAGRPELLAVIEADRLGQLRTGAASAVAARHLARGAAASLGVIGCGRQAEGQVACIRAALPSIERVVAYCRTPARLRDFCERVGAEAAESHGDAGEQDVVVTATTSRDPVLRGEWLQPGAVVCAVGANTLRARELDHVVLERAAFVCCDSKEQSDRESAGLV